MNELFKINVSPSQGAEELEVITMGMVLNAAVTNTILLKQLFPVTTREYIPVSDELKLEMTGLCNAD